MKYLPSLFTLKFLLYWLCLMRYFLSLFLCGLALSACQIKPSGLNLAPTLNVAPNDVQTLFVAGPYLISTGDRLRIVVFGQEALSNAYQVDSIGNVSMPLIGSVGVIGKTTQEIELAVKAKLRDGFVREPHVAVEVETYRPFFIMGEITASGQYPFVNGMTVQNAIAIAGGYLPRANRDEVEITRRIQGTLMKAKVPLTHQVYPGDIISINERWF
jgi:polysaccharide biosynthesis/export protein